jgi:hypothetical protein
LKIVYFPCEPGITGMFGVPAMVMDNRGFLSAVVTVMSLAYQRGKLFFQPHKRGRRSPCRNACSATRTT